jgi:hypothetical protein
MHFLIPTRAARERAVEKILSSFAARTRAFAALQKTDCALILGVIKAPKRENIVPLVG